MIFHNPLKPPKISSNPAVLFILTVLLTPLPFCFLGVTKDGLFMNCLPFNPGVYFLDPALRVFEGVEVTLLGRIDLLFLAYVVHAIILSPVLFVYLIIKRFFHKRLTPLISLSVWIMILAIYLALFYLYSINNAYQHPRQSGIIQNNSPRNPFRWEIDPSELYYYGQTK